MRLYISSQGAEGPFGAVTLASGARSVWPSTPPIFEVISPLNACPDQACRGSGPTSVLHACPQTWYALRSHEFWGMTGIWGTIALLVSHNTATADSKPWTFPSILRGPLGTAKAVGTCPARLRRGSVQMHACARAWQLWTHRKEKTLMLILKSASCTLIWWLCHPLQSVDLGRGLAPQDIGGNALRSLLIRVWCPTCVRADLLCGVCSGLTCSVPRERYRVSRFPAVSRKLNR